MTSLMVACLLGCRMQRVADSMPRAEHPKTGIVTMAEVPDYGKSDPINIRLDSDAPAVYFTKKGTHRVIGPGDPGYGDAIKAWELATVSRSAIGRFRPPLTASKRGRSGR